MAIRREQTARARTLLRWPASSRNGGRLQIGMAAGIKSESVAGLDRNSHFLDDGRICLTNNAAERALRGIALGRKSWLFAGSQRGAERAAFMYTLIQTAKLNEIDPQAWLADVLARIADIPQTRLSDLLPWNWRTALPIQTAA